MTGIAGEWKLRTERVVRSDGQIAATKVHVDSVFEHAAELPPGQAAAANAGHSHEHEHVHDNSVGSGSHDHSHGHSSSSSSGGGHDHSHGHSNSGSGATASSHGPSRNLKAIKNLIKSATGLAGCRKEAVKAFEVLAEAEAHVHGATLDQVGFAYVCAMHASRRYALSSCNSGNMHVTQQHGHL
jgi:uncharacterized protein (DUF111 family)